MNVKNNRQILDYVGDDGEFRVPIDEHAEHILSGELDYKHEYEPALDLLIYRYPFHGSLWKRWRQYVDYHDLVHQLPGEAVRELSWLARLTRDLSSPYNIFVGIFFYFGVPIICVLAIILIPSDKEWLQMHDEEILSDSVTYQSCVAYPDPDEESISVYRVTLEYVDEVNQIDTSWETSVAVRVPQEYEGWYQLDGVITEPGANIVLAEYFDDVVCE